MQKCADAIQLVPHQEKAHENEQDSARLFQLQKLFLKEGKASHDEVGGKHHDEEGERESQRVEKHQKRPVICGSSGGGQCEHCPEDGADAGSPAEAEGDPGEEGAEDPASFRAEGYAAQPVQGLQSDELRLMDSQEDRKDPRNPAPKPKRTKLMEIPRTKARVFRIPPVSRL